MNRRDFLEQFEDLVPYMDVAARIELAKSIEQNRVPEFNPIDLANWVMMAEAHKKAESQYWEQIKLTNRKLCKMYEAKK